MTNLSHVRKFGENTDIDTAADEDIWDGGGDYNWQSSAVALEAVSSSADDAAAGTGARTIRVFTLDSDYKFSDQTVTLNGLTAVDLTGTHVMVYRAYVVGVGSGEENAGNITIRVDDAGATVAQILATNGQTLMAVYMVPDDQKAFINCADASISRKVGAAAGITLRTSEDGESWRVRDSFGINATGASSVQRVYDFPIEVGPKGRISMRSTVDTNNTAISGGFLLTLANYPTYNWSKQQPQKVRNAP